MTSCQVTGELGSPGNPEVFVLRALIWLFFGPGAHQCSVLMFSYSLKLVTPLLASVVAFLPQLCSLRFLVSSGLEKGRCHHVLWFGSVLGFLG